MTNKFAVVTTFPNDHWDVYAESMVDSFVKHWPQEVPLLVQLDDQTITKEVQDVIRGNIDYCCNILEEDQVTFLTKKNGFTYPDVAPGLKYRYDYFKFSYKVFAIAKAALDASDSLGIDYLIWLDADVVTNKPVTLKDIESWIRPDTMGTYIGRRDWNTSETGMIIFNLKDGGKEFIRRWRDLYLTHALLKEEEWTDAYAFDLIRRQYIDANGRDVFFNITQGIEGRDVWDQSVLASHMTHHKGRRKVDVAQKQNQVKVVENLAGKSININNLNILTQNCVDHELIKKNVSANLQIIKKDNWLPVCVKSDEEIVICSAGPSLSADEILPWYEKGVKIVAVKHALEKLKKEGIVPWACILLDPRQHVGDFVKEPDTRVNYFVSSMVDPSVTKLLRDKGCKVYGYHAGVGAGEVERIPEGHLIIEGGSATATRGISLLEMLGFRKFHLYGYDCSYAEKPDLNDRKTNGKLRYEEVTLSVETWGGETATRTFWTEGQFLAQVQEFKKFYINKPSLTLHTYGNGIIPWIHNNMKKYESWVERQKAKGRKIYEDATQDINGFINGISKSSNDPRS